ncbi:guanylate kinase [Hathewaya proteolytica DSM 3090]|uniref:Guanylate kinase n=1 Tax=Hathewaya proteolytica DSM 3090 TaxID=1121331 RepID=A0A1M6JB04_9CLOT|nr:guanylate kinase [Hathewaya proteolytica]SHJ43854.1 guanylate kinase [Hathewaya proteolytica DSM 3090]
MKNKGLLVILSGPSGSGKGTICKELLKRDDFTLSISATTRNPRNGEINGKSYYFLSREEFMDRIYENEFLEYAEVYGNYYGTPKKMVMDTLNSGMNVLLEIDIQGALNVKDIYKEAVMIFIAPPSMEELKNRIVGRNSETEESLNIRFQSAYEELKYVPQYDYLVKNNNLEDAVADVGAILRAENLRVSMQENFYEELTGGI